MLFRSVPLVFDLLKRAQGGRYVFFRHANAVVGDTECQAAVAGGDDSDGYMTAGSGELDRVGEQINQDLFTHFEETDCILRRCSFLGLVYSSSLSTRVLLDFRPSKSAATKAKEGMHNLFQWIPPKNFLPTDLFPNRLVRPEFLLEAQP